MHNGSAGMDTFIIEDRKTVPIDDFEGLSFAMQRFEGHAIRHGIHRNR